jgi:hypothetical protein
VTCYTQPCRPCAGTHILHYLPQGGELSPRGSWGICALALPEVLTVQPTTDVGTPLTVHYQAGKASHSPGPMAINHRRRHVLYRDLPALWPSALLPAASDPSLIDVARGMQDMVAEARADRNDRADHRDASRRPKTTREKIGDRITDRLLVLCRVTSDEDLPPLYHEWAARPRGVSEIYVLQQAVEASCAALGVPVFEATPTQVMALKNFRLAGSTYFDIGLGLLPFSITPADATSAQARAMLVADRIRSDAFNTGADPESGTIGPGNVSRLRNLIGPPKDGLRRAPRFEVRGGCWGLCWGPVTQWCWPMEDSCVSMSD